LPQRLAGPRPLVLNTSLERTPQPRQGRGNPKRPPKRLVIAVLLAAIALSCAEAQQQQQQPRPQAKPAAQQAKPAAQQQAKPADPEQQKLSEQEETLRQRWLLKEKFNKGWDVTSENEHDKRWIASRCKTEARKQIPGIHPIKHRRFIKKCIAEAGR
jgi:hypothetical protein